MKIAYFNANLKKGQDGVTRVIYKMLDGALERNHQAIAITSTMPAEQDRIVPMYQVPSVALPLQKAYRIAVPGYQSFQNVLEQFQPDILHINSPCTLGFGAMKYAKQFDIPIVATYHTHFPKYPRYYNLTSLEAMTWNISRHLYNNVDKTFVPAQPILEELEQHDIHHLQYLPNGVDTGLFSPECRSEEWRRRFGSGQKPIILFVSRLVWEKDLRVLAKAHEILRSRRSDFEMVIVGDGHARTEFEAMMPGAHFLGYQSGQTLAESFASSDVFVFPSTTETFGLVTLEAMASGLAAVAANTGGAKEIIENGCSGIFCESLSGEDMAKKVEWLLDHPSYRKTIAAQAHLRAQHYRWDAILTRLFESYEHIIATFRHQRLRKKAA